MTISTEDIGKLEKLYDQSSRQQWVASEALDFSSEIKLTDEEKKIWAELTNVFYTLERMGLGVLGRMFEKASRELKSEETLLYLTLQCADEGRHVGVIKKYMSRLGYPVAYDSHYRMLEKAASMGPCRVENWLFSTLFSENFASAFLRRAKASNMDPLGSEMCRRILIDESRHIHFLNIVLPDLLARMSVFDRGYVKLSQGFIVSFTEKMSRNLASSAREVGIDRRELLEEVFANVEKTYENLGVTRDFLRFPTIH